MTGCSITLCFIKRYNLNVHKLLYFLINSKYLAAPLILYSDFLTCYSFYKLMSIWEIITCSIFNIYEIRIISFGERQDGSVVVECCFEAITFKAFKDFFRYFKSSFCWCHVRSLSKKATKIECMKMLILSIFRII